MCYLCLSFIGNAEKRNIDSTYVSNRIFSCAIYPVVTVYLLEGVAFALPQGRKFRHAMEVGVEADCRGAT